MTTFEPVQTPGGGIKDKMKLFGMALLVCVGGVSCFLLAANFRIDPFWVFVMFGSILLVAIIYRRYPDVLVWPGGRIFLVVWAVLHGILTAVLIKRAVTMTLWLPIFACEFGVGFLLMRRINSRRGGESS